MRCLWFQWGKKNKVVGLPDFQTGVGPHKTDVKVDTSNFDDVEIEHGGNPPKYEDISNLQSSKEHVTQVLQDSHKRGYLEEVASRHQMIIVDDNFRLSKPLKKTIQLTADLLHLCHVKLGANSTTTFMSYRNSEDDSLMKDEDREVMLYLQDLFGTSSRDHARKVIDAFSTHINDPRVENVAKKFRELEKTAETNVDVAHDEFLGFVRSQKAVFHKGWKSSSIIGPKFHSLYEEACENASKQEASLNSLRFSLERALDTFEYQRKENIFRPTNIVFVCGSKLQKSEITKLREILNKTTDGITAEMKSEISIQVLACWHENQSSIEGHKQLDNHKKGNADIYDCTSISSQILFGGPGNFFFAKAHNGHLKEWDDKKYGADDIVNFTRAREIGQRKEKGNFVLPTVADIEFG
jgi:hypothetical protein